MKIKYFEVRDSCTFIPVVAMLTESDDEREQYLLKRTGYGPDGALVILMRLDTLNAQYSPSFWLDRTMSLAHEHISEKFDNLETGDVIDVQYILGETEEPKVSEKLDDVYIY